MHFPASGVDVSPLVPPLVAFAISLFTSTGGVSGAFLILPFQMSVLHFTSPAVSSTNQLYNIVAIPSGVWRYIREGRMVWPLAWVVIAGTLPGVLVGAILRVRYLPDPARFRLFAGAVLLYIGGRLVWDLLSRRRTGGVDAKEVERQFQTLVRQQGAAEGSGPSGGRSLPRVVVRSFTPSRIAYEFQGEVFDVSTPGLFALSLVIGVVGGVYGIGGGAIIAPFLVAFFGLPVYTVAGAALMGTLVTSVAGVAFYQAIAPFYPRLAVAPDYPLGLLFGVGGMAGIYLGARLQKYLPAKAIKGMLAAVIVFLAAKYLAGFFR
jgi:uncharacterized membrane protein YfcA